jgi:hypothetical protein
MGKLELGADLTDAQTADIVSFLGSLTGRVPDALLTAPILPSTQGFDSPSPNR